MTTSVQTEQRWVRTYDNGSDFIESLDGVDWSKAPLPPVRHQCTPQTRGWMRLSYVERCACGAIRMDGFKGWAEKNETRKSRERRGIIEPESAPARWTRRGRIVRNIAVVLLIALGLTLLVWAWESGQANQCDWQRQHGTAYTQARYCGP